jgi:ABC-type transport system involved in multi-copper enzyme maturation permease subunit
MSAQRLLSVLWPQPLVQRPYRASALAGLIVLAGAALYWGNRLALVPQILLWATLALAAAVAVRDLPERLLGPVLFYDLVQTSRRGRYLVLRCGYAGVLLALLAFSYHNELGLFNSTLSSGFLFGSPRQLTRFANEFFLTFVAMQFLAVLLFTPLFTASVVTEERERKTLDYLLSTDLGDHEIILSKLVARLIYTVVLMLAGLPVLGLIQFLGGVDPNRVLASFAATAATMGSLGALGVLVSVHNRNTWDAVFRTYLFATVCLVGTMVFGAALGAPTIAWLNLGNPILALLQLEEATRTPIPTTSLGEILLAYCTCHGVAMVLFAWLAVVHFRAAALAEKPSKQAAAEQPLQEPNPFAQSVRRRPPVTDDSLVWKEVHEKPVNWARRASPETIAIMTVGIVVCYLFLLVQIAVGDKSETWTVLLGVIGAAWYLFMLLLVALSAAGRFSGEIERQTLDSLLLVPARDRIPYAKWLASILQMRLGWWFLAWVICIGAARGMSLQCLLLSAAAWWVYAAFLASLGLWFSLVSRSTSRATLLTLLLAFTIVFAGAWTAEHVEYYVPLPKWARTLQRGGLEDFGMAGPFSLWAKALDNDTYWSAGWFQVTLTFLPGLAFYAFLGWLFWRMARARFELLTGEAFLLWPRRPPETGRVLAEVEGRVYEDLTA